MKKLTAALLTGSALLLFTACGSSGSSSSGGSTLPPSYTTIQDLEFKTLNIAETWKQNGAVTYTTMKFTNNYKYTSDGTPMLIDDTSSVYHEKLCSEAPAGGVAPNGAELKYLCVGIYDTGSTEAWGLAIDNGGIISGNFHFLTIGSSDVAVAVISPSTSYAYLEGGVSSTVATLGLTIVSTDEVGDNPEVVVPNVDDDINKEELYSELASDIPQETATEEVSPEIQQAINKLHEHLLQVQSEK